MWKPSDFIVNGIQCDNETIYKQADKIRKAFNAKAALLIVVGKTIYPSLCIFSHQDNDITENAKKYLVGDQFTNYNSDFIMEIKKVDDDKFINLIFSTKPFNLVKSDLLISGEFDSICVLYEKNENISNVLIRLILFLNRKNANEVKSYKKLMYDLRCMVNASIPVMLSNKSERIFLLEQKLEILENKLIKYSIDVINSSTLINLDAVTNITGSQKKTSENYLLNTIINVIAKEYLELSIKETNSDIGNIFFLNDENRETLILIAENGGEGKKFGDQLPIYRDKGTSTEGKSRSIVTYVYDTQKPLLINDILEYKRTHPKTSYVWFSEDDYIKTAYAELAVPIYKSKYKDQKTNSIGVLNVEKTSNKKGDYNYNDLETLRSIAARFALLISQISYMMSYNAIAKLTRLNAAKIYNELLNEKNQEINECKLAENIINEALCILYILTKSISVTFRILSPDTKKLIRHYAFPIEILDQSGREIEMKSLDSINVWVAKYGMEFYASNVNDKSIYKVKDNKGLMGRKKIPERGEVHSELCIPLFINDRIYGTINLESLYKDAYDNDRFFCRVISQQIGLAILQARSVIEQRIISMSSKMVTNYHELGKCKDEIYKIVNEIEAIENPGIEISSIKRELIELRSKFDNSIGRNDEAQSLIFQTNTCFYVIDIIKDVISNIIGLPEEEQKRYYKILYFDSEKDYKIDSKTSEYFKLAFNEIFFNAYHKALGFRNGLVSIAIGKKTIGGKCFHRILIKNDILVNQEKSLKNIIYRIPIEKDKIRPHLGAFIAGTLIRNIGGDVYLYETKDEKKFVSAIELPSI